MPIQQELQMIFVDKDLRPVFSSLLILISVGVGIINGLSTQFYLLKTMMAGYAHGYYIVDVLYVIGVILRLTFFKKKYSHSMENSNEEN